MILAVGNEDLVEEWCSRVDEVIDLGGRTVVPGLTDSHIHLVEHGLTMRHVALAECDSASEVVESLREARPDSGDWLIGTGFQVNRWADGVVPHRVLLDEHFPERPVLLHSRCLHQVWVNSAALRGAGVTRHTTDPAGGVIVRDEAGEPTGLLQEEAVDLVTRAAPEPAEAARREAMRAATEDLWSHGVVAVHTPESSNTLCLMAALHRERELHIRTLFLPPFAMGESLAAAGQVSGMGDRWLRLGALKVFTDGALGSSTALMHEPYEGQPGNRGVEVTSADELREMAEWAHAHRWRMAVHAIGDRAVDFTVEVLSEVQARNDPTLGSIGVWDRIEHMQCLGETTAARAGRARIGAMLQPIHMFDDWRPADRLWGARGRRAYACRSLLEAGVPVAFGSDAPVASTNPFHSIHAAVTRTDLSGEPAGGWHSEQAIDVAAALEAHCTVPARIAGECQWRGKISPGCVADFALLNFDPWVPGLDWRTVEADMTVVDGAVVHDRHGERSGTERPEFAEMALGESRP
jgi:predicted amidohydrolase YtcJ